MVRDDAKVLFNINVWDIVEKGFEEPLIGTMLSEEDSKKLEQNRRLDSKALHYLSTKVQLHVFNKFIHAKTAKEAWSILMTAYCGSPDVKKIKLQELRRQYELAQMKPTESVKEFLGRITDIANAMESNGEKLEEGKIV